MIRNILSILAVLVMLISYSSAYPLKPFTTESTWLLESKDIKIYKLENLNLKKLNSRYVFQINENTNHDINNYDLYLDFEEPNLDLLNYKIIYSKFEMNKYQSINGNYSGKFYFSDNYISMLPLPTSIFAPGNIIGSFTIDFWLYTYKDYDYQYIIKYIGNNLSDEKDKNNYGFSIFIKNGRVVYQFMNFFFTEKKESVSLDIKDEDNIILNKWEHHALTFDIKSGKISVYKNGMEQDVKWVTESGAPLSEVLTPKIKEEMSAPFLIGKSAFFSLDNFKIGSYSATGFDLKKFNTANSYMITDVYKYSTNKAALKKISFQADSPDYSFIKMAYRISDTYFLPGDKDIKWIYLQNGSENFPPDLDGGKYIQFMLSVFPYEDEDKEVNIYSIRMDYSVDNTPANPVITGAKPMDGKILMSWIPSPEDDIAGYEIYYGNRIGDYICDEAAEGKSPIFVPADEPGRINQMSYMLTGLVNEKPYFISVRSVDRNGNRSQYSKEIYARPSTIFNDNKYSVGR